MAAHRIWRLTTTANSVTSYTGYPKLAELRLSTVAGGPSVATGGTASADDVAGSNAASNAFDGDPATFWSAASGFPHWLQIDFGPENARDIVEFAITARPGADAANAPRDFALSHSDDGASFAPAFGTTGQAFAGGETRSFAVPPPPPDPNGRRFWRLDITATSQAYNGYHQVAELRLSRVAGGPQAAVGGTASASEESTPNIAVSAFDGNPATFWSSGDFTHQDANHAWLQYDFTAGHAQAIAEFAITARAGSADDALNAPRDFTLRCSDNGTDFTIVLTAAGQAFAAGETKVYAVLAAAARPRPQMLVVS